MSHDHATENVLEDQHLSEVLPGLHHPMGTQFQGPPLHHGSLLAVQHSPSQCLGLEVPTGPEKKKNKIKKSPGETIYFLPEILLSYVCYIVMNK